MYLITYPKIQSKQYRHNRIVMKHINILVELFFILELEIYKLSSIKIATKEHTN